MSNLGTFDAFTAAQLGIYAAQHGLRVTGNNISNLSTTGYTRQRIDQVSFKSGGSDMYRSQIDNHVGSGALVTGISQIRDPYLDIRFRNTTADVGYTDTWLDGLKNIASILDEVGKGLGEDEQDGMLYAQLQDLADALRGLSNNPSSDDNTLVRTSAEALCSLFNTYATKLQTLYGNTDARFKQDISDVNGILTNIRNLNEEIRNSEIHGDNALEMRDERNRQIDALAEYMHINVIYSMEDIGAGQEVEKLTIVLAGDNPDSEVTTDSSMLIDGIYGAQISMQRPVPNPNPNTNTDLPFLDENGNPTKYSKDAAMEDSPNYDITISRLYDSRGRLWTNPVTITEPMPTAEYSYKLEKSNWADGDTVKIAGTTYAIGQNPPGAEYDIIPLETANNLVSMAEFIAKKLNAAGNDTYKISAKNGSIVYTAKQLGEVEPPNLKVEILDEDGNVIDDTDATDKIDFGPASFTPSPVDLDNLPPSPTYEYDPVTGNKVLKTELSYTKINGTWYEVKTVTEYSREVTLDDNDLYGSLQASRELLTEKGEFASNEDIEIDESALSKRGIPYYQLSLDLLARQVATQYNSLNKGYMVNHEGNYIDADGKPITLGDGSYVNKASGLTDAQLEALGAVPAEGAGNLFSVLNNTNDDVDADGNGITASNITVSKGWSTGDIKVVTTFVQLFGEDGEPLPNTTQNENVNHMVSMIEQSLVYDPKLIAPDAAGEKLFDGCFNDMFSNMMGVEGKDERIMNVRLTTSYASQVELDSSRDGVSGVDLNDEAMNMMQYQKAYSAACRMMTVIDEVLDRLINNTGIAGR